MLKKLCEKLRANFPATTHGYSMIRIPCLDDVFLRICLPGSKPSGRSTTAAKRKEKEKKKAKNSLKIGKPKNVGDFLISKF